MVAFMNPPERLGAIDCALLNLGGSRGSVIAQRVSAGARQLASFALELASFALEKAIPCLKRQSEAKAGAPGWTVRCTVSSMRVFVLYFAGVREKLGRDRDELEMPTGASVRDAVRAAQVLRPGLTPFDPSIRVARNREFASYDDLLQDDDELALIPPVSGG
jgi:molybdopterin converting factor subunit 1